MADTLSQIRQFLESTKFEFEVMDCNPDLADTKIFCREYGINLEDSVNAVLVKTKTGELKYNLSNVLRIILSTLKEEHN